jgi:hypothetical protein
LLFLELAINVGIYKCFFFNLGLWYYLKLLYTISLGLEVGVVYGLIFLVKIIIFIYIFIKVMLFFFNIFLHLPKPFAIPKEKYPNPWH